MTVEHGFWLAQRRRKDKKLRRLNLRLLDRKLSFVMEIKIIRFGAENWKRNKK